MFGVRTELMKTGIPTRTDTGFTQAAAGCGYHITAGAGDLIITEDGGGHLNGAGYGHPVTSGRPPGLYG